MRHILFGFGPVLVLICLLSIVSGCGRFVPVRGKVTFSDDGSPLTCGTVMFDNGKQNGFGAVRKDGTYVVNFGKEKGLPKGKWNVSIVGTDVYEYAKEKDSMGNVVDSIKPISITPLIDSKYMLPETSDLSFDADGKTNVYDIVVDRANKKR